RLARSSRGASPGRPAACTAGSPITATSSVEGSARRPAASTRRECAVRDVARRALAVAGVVVLTACGGGGTSGPSSPRHPPATVSSEAAGSAPAPSAAAASATSSGGWPTYHHDPVRTGVDRSAPAMGSVHRAWTSPQLDGDVY